MCIRDSCANGSACENGTCVSGSLPSTPTNLTATVENTQVTLNWNASTGATSYEIYGGDNSSAAVYIASTDTTSYTVNLPNGVSYGFYVLAVNNYGTSSPTNTVYVQIVPLPPTITITGSGISTSGTDYVTFNGNASTGANGYYIYDSTTSGGPYTKNSGICGGFPNDCAAVGLNRGTTYYFVITAVNAGGESGYSNEVSITTP